MTSIILLSFITLFFPIVFIDFIKDALDEKEMEYIGINIKHR